MNTRIFHTINSGLYFGTSTTGVWIDCLHGGDKNGMTSLNHLMIDKLFPSEIETQKKLLLFTHSHEDHFDKNLVEVVLNKYQDFKVIIPDKDIMDSYSTIYDNNLFTITFGDFIITAINTLHEGSMYRDVSHYAYVLTHGDSSFFVAGDGLLNKDVFSKIPKEIVNQIKIIFVNAFHLNDDDCISFIKSVFPDYVGLYHLPRPEDDIYQYSNLANYSIKKNQINLPKIKRLEHFNWL